MPIDQTKLDQLPEMARDRFEALHQARDEALGLAKWGSDKRQRVYDRLDELDREEARLRARSRGVSDVVAEVAERIERIEADRQKASAELEAINGQLAEYEATAQHLSGLCQASARWLRTVPAGAKLTMKQGRAASDLDKARRSCAAIKAEIHEIESAPIPSGEAKVIAREMVDRLAEAGRPNVARTVEGGLSPSWGKAAPIYDMVPEGADMSAALPLSVLAWICRDTLVSAMDAEIDAQADDDAAIRTQDRASKTARLKAKLLDAERDEVATHHAVNGERDWSLRRDLDPRAVLLVEIKGGAS